MTTTLDRPPQLVAGTMLHGVQLSQLATHVDHRGSFTEVFRDEWGLPIEPVQWSIVVSKPRVLRGMHLHLRHDEYFMVVKGRACVGLYDCRADSPTADKSALFELNSQQMCALSFPRGIIHGWYFYQDGIHLQAVSECYSDYSDDDNLGCHWSDPQLNIPWPDQSPVISERSASFPMLAGLRASIAQLVQQMA